MLFEKKSNEVTKIVLIKGNEKNATRNLLKEFDNLIYYWRP